MKPKTEWIHEIHIVTPVQVQLVLVQIDCTAIQETLVRSAKDNQSLLDGIVREILKSTNHQLRVIEKKCVDIMELSALQSFIKQVSNKTLPSLNEKIKQSIKRRDLLLKYHSETDTIHGQTNGFNY